MTTTKITGEAVPARGDLIGRYGHRLNEIGLLAAILILYIVLGLTTSGFWVWTTSSVCCATPRRSASRPGVSPW